MINNQKSFVPIIVVLIIVAILVAGALVWRYELLPKEEAKAPDLTRFSIKDLSLLSLHTLTTEKVEPWEEIKGEMDIKNIFYQDFMNLQGGKPLLIILDVRRYTTLERAGEEFNELYEIETELGTKTEKNKEDIKIGGHDAKLSLRRPDTGSYLVEILLLDGATVIRLWAVDFSQYYQDIAIEIAKEIVERITFNLRG